MDRPLTICSNLLFAQALRQQERQLSSLQADFDEQTERCSVLGEDLAAARNAEQETARSESWLEAGSKLDLEASRAANVFRPHIGYQTRCSVTPIACTDNRLLMYRA